jgi:peptidoglycan hydrolase-like protein with peptidoglycan-binding domain
MDLQKRLNQYGAHLKVDGRFGPKTQAAVKQFQETHKDAAGKPLKADGLVGPKTTSALRSKTKQEYLSTVAKNKKAGTTKASQAKPAPTVKSSQPAPKNYAATSTKPANISGRA